MRKGPKEKRWTWDRAKLTPEALSLSMGPINTPLGPKDAQEYPKDQEVVDEAVKVFKRKRLAELKAWREEQAKLNNSKPT